LNHSAAATGTGSLERLPYRGRLAKLGDPRAKKGLGFANTDVAGFQRLLDSLSKVRNRPRYMIFSPGTGSSRREFFRTGARYGLLGMLAMLAALMGTNRHRCLNQGLCNSCAVFTRCGLPQALSAKQSKARGVI
jgi:hypothetical protein